uniref:PLC-beta PH domain-containing protein n=1 Tax=Anopheles maculatus TaxID=74869 RepID=A0A182T6G1_9DIPT
MAVTIFVLCMQMVKSEPTLQKCIAAIRAPECVPNWIDPGYRKFVAKDSCNGTPVTLRVDVKGFFLYWVDQNHEMDMLDIATIRDVRTGQYAKKPRVSSIKRASIYGTPLPVTKPY